MPINRFEAQHCGPSHYQGCNCQQWRYEQMDTALKIIQVWAEIDAKFWCDKCRDAEDNFLRIAIKAKEALEGKP